MSETRKISFLVSCPAGRKSVSRLLEEIKQKIKEARENNKELEKYELTDVGMCRTDESVRVTLYFSIKEQKDINENEIRG